MSNQRSLPKEGDYLTLLDAIDLGLTKVGTKSDRDGVRSLWRNKVGNYWLTENWQIWYADCTPEQMVNILFLGRKS